MPTEHGFRLDNDKSATPSGPAAREQGPEEPVGPLKPDLLPRSLAVEHEQLMAKGQDLGVEGSPASEERSERANDGQNGRDHARIRLGEMRELLNDFQAVEILGRPTPVAEEVRVEVGDSRWGPSAVGRRRPQQVPAEPYDLGHTLSVQRRDTLSTSCGLATHGFESPKARRSSPTRIATSPP